jgi:hypothetical protein
MQSLVVPLAAQLDHERCRANDAAAAERIAALEAAALRGELAQASANAERADRAVRLLEEEQQRSRRLEMSLADTAGAERIAAGEAAALRGELDRRREWRFLSRLRWALRGDRKLKLNGGRSKARTRWLMCRLGA